MARSVLALATIYIGIPFAGSGGSGGGGGAGGTASDKPCDVEMHTLMHDLNGDEWTVEGGPERFNAGDWGKLIQYEKENGNGLKGNNPRSDKRFGGRLVVPCPEVDLILSTERAFKRTADYQILGPNSNSFMSWLLTKVGLSMFYPTPPLGSTGWGDPIPGN